MRDKLLGKQSHDIDIVLDTMTGYNFGTLINNHLNSIDHKRIGIHKIESNPEKSKHLETATIRLYFHCLITASNNHSR